MIKTKWKHLLTCILLAISILAGGCSLSLSTENGENSTKVGFEYEINTTIGLQTTESPGGDSADQPESGTGDEQVKEDGT